MLSVELIWYHPLTKKAVQTKNITEEGTDFVESSLEEKETAQQKLNIHKGNFLNFKEQAIAT